MALQGSSSTDLQHQHKVMGVYLELAQYPILARNIRELMRQELFAKGIITVEDFEAEVKEKAVLSQRREGLADPLFEEPAHVWSERLAFVRDQLTDFYFAYNLPHDRLEEIIKSVLAGRGFGQHRGLSFNPELAPWDLLFAQAEEYERLSPARREAVQHHLREILVVLIKGMISDQLQFVGVAKQLFTIEDLKEIRRRRIGRGKIGGKAAGMLLARKILQIVNGEDDVDIRPHVTIPDSYFIGADVFYDFLSINDLIQYMNLKYKTPEEIKADYESTRAVYLEGCFPSDVVYGLKEMLQEVGDAPLIVRSSSLLEDNFGTAFAGKYDSFFCPNQGTLEENLEALTNAIIRVYASGLSPDALLYRQRMGLVDYDERMAVLIQKVQGERYHDYFFPTLAGVGYSYNPFSWDPRIQREEGFLRLVCGMGTRAVDRVAADYPRIMALSHPQLRPQTGVKEIRRYSQHFIDVINVRDNTFSALPVKEVIQHDYPALRYLASVDNGGYLAPIISRLGTDAGDLVLTFDQLSRDRRFIDLMKAILEKLQRYYKWPVDIEFTVHIVPKYPQAEYTVSLLQCRPLVSHEWLGKIEIPERIPESDLIFAAHKLVPQGVVSQVRYIVYVDPQGYNRVPDPVVKLELARLIGRLNKRLEDERFILMGPGRWGSSNLELGVKVGYADIYNAKMLIEVPLAIGGSTAEASYGTHFFQDLVESGIFPLPVSPDEDGGMLNTSFLKRAPNHLPELLPADAPYARYVRVIDVPAFTGGRYLEVVMDGEHERAVGYLKTE